MTKDLKYNYKQLTIAILFGILLGAAPIAILSIQHFTNEHLSNTNLEKYQEGFTNGFELGQWDVVDILQLAFHTDDSFVFEGWKCTGNQTDKYCSFCGDQCSIRNIKVTDLAEVISKEK